MTIMERPDVDALFAFAKYLSWADLQNRLFEEELQREKDSDDLTSTHEHEWRWWGQMSYWYASLYVVVEAWEEMGFADPVIDRLLRHPRDFRGLLRRYRNAVFHFQKSVLSEKITDFLTTGTSHIVWVRAIHDELVRWFLGYLRAQVVTDQQFCELRESFTQTLHWFPYDCDPLFDSLARVLESVRRELAERDDYSSPERLDLANTLDWAEGVLRTGKAGWASLRRDILRNAIDALPGPRPTTLPTPEH